MQFAPFHNLFFFLNLILHFLLSLPTWLFSPTMFWFNSNDCFPHIVSQFGSVDPPWILQLSLLLQFGTKSSLQPMFSGFLLLKKVCSIYTYNSKAWNWAMFGQFDSKVVFKNCQATKKLFYFHKILCEEIYYEKSHYQKLLYSNFMISWI